ncbi:hypothetical protein GW17_00009452 [Ensete ventricosum]|nr:hypothetical protein GW17_00009452 [Ensete ventricosum]RZR78329.1 hypothetical protein BHM03_00003611 [Ensete ventricosum]
MIELPWNSDEEKHLHKCLFDHGSQNPSSTCGSLLVVFYLQVISKKIARGPRRRAGKDGARYSSSPLISSFLLLLLPFFSLNRPPMGEIDCRQSILAVLPGSEWFAYWSARFCIGHVSAKNSNISVCILFFFGSKSYLLCQQDKCLDLLPEVQRQKILAENVTDCGHVSLEDVQMSLVSDLSNAQPNLSTIPNNSSVILQTNSSSYALRKSNAHAASPMHDNNFGTASKVPSAIQRRLLVSFESPSPNVNAVATDGVYSSYPVNGVIPSSIDTNVRDMIWQADMKQAFQPVDGDHSVKFHRGSKAKPTRGPNSSAARVLRNENSRLVFPRVTSADHSHDGSRKESVHDPIQSSRRNNLLDGSLTMISREAYASSFSFELTGFLFFLCSFERSDIPEDKSRMVGSRWRSDESSEDEEDFESAKLTVGGASVTSRRRPRLFRK